MDAANVDLKASPRSSTASVCGGAARRRCSTRCATCKHETDVWFEITTLLIPGENDSDAELDAADAAGSPTHLGPDVPLHFTAFHPDYKMLDRAADAARDADPGPRHRAAPTACATSTPATSTTRRAAAPTATPAARR